MPLLCFIKRITVNKSVAFDVDHRRRSCAAKPTFPTIYYASRRSCSLYADFSNTRVLSFLKASLLHYDFAGRLLNIRIGWCCCWGRCCSTSIKTIHLLKASFAYTMPRRNFLHREFLVACIVTGAFGRPYIKPMTGSCEQKTTRLPLGSYKLRLVAFYAARYNKRSCRANVVPPRANASRYTFDLLFMRS